MNPRARFTAMLTGLVLLLHITPSGSQPVCAAPGCNPTVSGFAGNTAGGTDALANVDLLEASANTAFGFLTLSLNTTGDLNTAP